MVKVGIVTVLYNGEKVVKDFFDTLNRQVYRDFKLYVVDNNSSDNCLKLSEELSKHMFFETEFIKNKNNLGVAEGNNQGIKKALNDGCEYILLSNNDVVLENNTILNLITSSIDKKSKLSTNLIFFHGTNKVWYAGGEFIYNKGIIEHWNFGENEYLNNEEYVDYAPTCFMLIHKDVFNKVGFMDKEYFVYFDDTDFIYRCLQKGYRTLYCPSSILYHKESASTGGQKSLFTVYHYTRNNLYFILKNFKGIIMMRAVAYYFAVKLKAILVSKYETKKAIFRGIKDGIKMVRNNIK